VDKTPIEPVRLEAGRRFVSSLQGLGLKTPLALWVRLKDEGTYILMIVTDFFDLKGPLELTKYMFAAYNADALPHDIDPFNVQFCSPHQMLGRRLIEMASIKVVGSNNETGETNIPMEIGFDRYITWLEWFILNDFDAEVSYKRSSAALKRRPDATALRRQWQYFAKNVDKLAA
jgi:hypothetical protein